MKLLIRTSRLLGALALILLASCSDESHSAGDDAEFPKITLGSRQLTIELAITRSEQAKGLMHRDGIADDHGMLFVYETPQKMSYWMKNVDFNIDIGFFTADGVLREVYPMYAQDTLSRKSIRDDILYALETRHNWYSDNEIRPGAKLDLVAVREAIEQRKQSSRK